MEHNYYNKNNKNKDIKKIYNLNLYFIFIAKCITKYIKYVSKYETI